MRGKDSALVVCALITVLLTACTSDEPKALPTPTPSPSVAGGIPLPDFGPVPTPSPLTEAETIVMRDAVVETAWAKVIARFPDARRPAVAFTGYYDEVGAAALVRCLNEGGLSAYLSLDGTAYEVSGLEGEDEDFAIGTWFCQAKFPDRPNPPVTEEQLNYLYDFLVEFTAPCIESFGYTIPDAPSREYFIENWPNQNWFPVPPADTEHYGVAMAACPHGPEGFN